MFWFAVVFGTIAGAMLWYSTRQFGLLVVFICFHLLSACLLFAPDPPKPKRKVLTFALGGVAFAIAIFVFANQFAKDSYFLWFGAICSCDATMNFLNHRTELRGPA